MKPTTTIEDKIKLNVLIAKERIEKIESRLANEGASDKLLEDSYLLFSGKSF